MKSNVSYREYEEKDFADLVAMMACLYEEDPEGEAISDDKIRKTVGEYFTNPEKLRIVMICADGAAIGYSLLVFFWSNEYGGDILHIDELYITKEYRNNRVASDFIGHLPEIYKNAVAVAVEVTPSNSAAAGLYERLGFEPSPNRHLLLHPVR